MAAKVVIVFDFDKTIIEVDSDNWVIDELGATDLFNQLLPLMPWNSLMDKMMQELHEQGKTIEDIKEVLRRVPIHPRVVPAIKTAYDLGCELRIVSDVNTLFIETVLDHLGIRHCFSEINTNSCYIDEVGRLRIEPYESSLHGCTNPCPPNMCKGKIIERIQGSLVKTRMIYLGDGLGDFCPSLKLKYRDFMMPRKDFPVWDLIRANRALLKSEIYEWTNGEEMERILASLIAKIEYDSIHNADSAQLLPVDCKLEIIPSAAYGIALPQIPSL